MDAGGQGYPTCFVRSAACQICRVGVHGVVVGSSSHPEGNRVLLTACMQLW
jgi:hypothetical protein